MEPFIFYALKQVVLTVGVRELFSHAPMTSLLVELEVAEPPVLPRPPVVKPEWCESPEGWAARVLDQLVDYVVTVRAVSHGTGMSHGEGESQSLGCIYSDYVLVHMVRYVICESWCGES